MAADRLTVVLKENLSSNAAFDEFVDGNNMSEIIGYVDEIVATKPVSNGRYNLFKYTLSNDDRRVQVCVWGEKIAEHEAVVNMRSVLHIDGALCKRTSQNYWRQGNNLVANELHIQSHTLVSLLGVYPAPDGAELPQAGQALTVTFETIDNVADGTLIEISGALKMKFRPIISPGRSNRYGCCTLTDGTWKITVVVNNFNVEHQASAEAIEKGDGLTIIGVVKVDVNNMIKVICDNFSRVIPNDFSNLDDQQLNEGVKTRLHAQ